MSFQERAKLCVFTFVKMLSAAQILNSSLEERWPYFLGFGLPCTVISFFHSSPLVNLSLFSLVFPLMLLLASIAKPLPAPDSSSDLLPAEGLSRTATPHKFFPKRMPVLFFAVKAAELMHNPSIRRMLSTQTEKKSSTPTSYGVPSAASTPRFQNQPRPYQAQFSSPYRAQQSYTQPSARKDLGGGVVNSGVAMRPAFGQTSSSSGVTGRRRIDKGD